MDSRRIRNLRNSFDRNIVDKKVDKKKYKVLNIK